MMSPRKSLGHRKIRAACLQLNAGRFWQVNLAKALQLSVQAVCSRASLIALPEMFFWCGPAEETSWVAAEACPVVLNEFRRFARIRKVHILLGSLLEPAAKRGFFYNTSYLISSAGKVTAKYRKMHLFDVCLSSSLRLQESKRILPGKNSVSAKVNGIRTGLSICYDLRFPELYRTLTAQGCRILFVPANFTHETGKAHWEVLIRARAIENQAFVIAPAQVGRHPGDGVRSYGNSLIVDPWGTVLQRASGSREQVILSDLDLGLQNGLRRRLPALKHIRMKIPSS